jgi:hypothetical protein
MATKSSTSKAAPEPVNQQSEFQIDLHELINLLAKNRHAEADVLVRKMLMTKNFGERQNALIRFLEEIFPLSESLKSYQCKGIQEKFSETTSWSKIPSLTSELFFANEFAKLGFSVELISDSESNWQHRDKRIPSPDFLASKDGESIFVEVARIGGDETISQIIDAISPLLSDTSFCAEIQYTREFSWPTISHNERTKRENLIEDFVEHFKTCLQDAELPTSSLKYDIFGCQISLIRTPNCQPGYYKGSNGAVITIPEFKAYVAYQIEKKAKKRQNWNHQRKQIPYLVALDIQQSFILSPIFVQWLFGSRTSLNVRHANISENPYSEPDRVSDAKSQGWKDLLEKVGFNSRERVEEGGILMTHETLNNISGLVVNMSGIPHFIPNPFAEESINCPHLCDLIPLPMGEDGIQGAIPLTVW